MFLSMPCLHPPTVVAFSTLPSLPALGAATLNLFVRNPLAGPLEAGVGPVRVGTKRGLRGHGVAGRGVYANARVVFGTQ